VVNTGVVNDGQENSPLHHIVARSENLTKTGEIGRNSRQRELAVALRFGQPPASAGRYRGM